MGVMLGYLRDDSHELEGHWLGNYRGGVRVGRVRWYLYAEDSPAETLLADDMAAHRLAHELSHAIIPIEMNDDENFGPHQSR
jgi:hypothetical protein